jgi:hypothetical protein
MYTVKVKCNGINHTWTQTEHFDNEPTNADIKERSRQGEEGFLRSSSPVGPQDRCQRHAG